MANTRNEAARAAMQSPGMRQGLSELWGRIIFLFVALVVFRFGAHVPVPGINPVKLAQLFEQNKEQSRKKVRLAVVKLINIRELLL